MKKLPWLLSLAFMSAPALAADLMQVYREAQDNDPVFAAARATVEAGREKTDQGLSGLLPTVVATGNTTWNENKVVYKSGVYPEGKPKFNSNGYAITLTQPLFRWQNWVQYQQGKLQTAQAEAQFLQARQDLILRVAQAYFDVLYGQENLKALKIQQSAIAQQLELAKKSFEVGTATATDTHEAQARFDLAQAQVIAAESDLEVRQHALQAIIGKAPNSLSPLRSSVQIKAPQPASMEQWVTAAEQENLGVQTQMAAAEIAAKEVERNRAGHLPTVDVVASKGKSNTLASTMIGMTEADFYNVGLQVTIPLFQGGYVSSRSREAAANRTAALSGLEAARRQSALGARQAYLGSVNGLATVKALETALASSKLALASNKLGYEVGVRINIDVLNAEQQVYSTERDLAKARFDTLMAQLKLKAAAGRLSDEDVQQVNALLETAKPAAPVAAPAAPAKESAKRGK